MNNHGREIAVDLIAAASVGIFVCHHIAILSHQTTVSILILLTLLSLLPVGIPTRILVTGSAMIGLGPAGTAGLPGLVPDYLLRTAMNNVYHNWWYIYSKLVASIMNNQRWIELFLSALLSVGILKIIERMTTKTRGTIQRLSSMRAIKTTKDEAQLFQVRLPMRKGVDRIDSPEFTCFGHRWYLRVHPGGDATSANGKVAVYLYHKSGESIEVQATFTVKSTATRTTKKYSFQPAGSASGVSWGFKDFAQRSTLIGALQQGALIIDVQMRQTHPADSPHFVPENPFSKLMLKRFMDEKSADVIFEVVETETSSTTSFFAHRFILEGCAPTLFDLSTSAGDAMVPIPIMDVKPDIFRHLLCYAYGGTVSDEDLKANAKEIIDAADRYEVVSLKLKAEASFVTSTTITIDNVMDNLLFADSKNCALLKEAVMEFVVENVDDVYKKISFDDVPGHLMKDLLSAMQRKGAGKKGNGNKSRDKYTTMKISDLRKQLHGKGLDVDGSRETMIATLKESS